MKYSKYVIEFTDDRSYYWFTSKNVLGEGSVIKIVRIQPTAIPGRYNLALGDVVGGVEIYDNRTRHGDLIKVFGTIAKIVLDFTTVYPQAEIAVKTNNPIKQRLYRMNISNNLEEIRKIFIVYGKTDENEPFTEFQKGKNYLSILVSRK